MSILARLRNIKQNNLVRSASILVGGTAVAQALTIIALPLLTRLYTPEEFAVLAVYIAMLTMGQVIICGRLEIAIPLPESDADAANLLALCLASTVFLTLALVLFLWVFGDWFFFAINQSQLQPYAWLLPIGLVSSGLYASLQYWNTRQERFASIARTRIVQSGTGLIAQLGLGWAGVGGIGLLAGHAIMSGSGFLRLGREAIRLDMEIFRNISMKGMLCALATYRRFPIFSMWEAFANNAALQIPVLLIAAVAAGPEVGFILLASRIIGTPVTMLGSAIGQVYLSKAPSHMRQGTLSSFTRSVLFTVARTGAIPLILIGLTAPWLVDFIFGDEWRRAGTLISWMIPWFLLKLLASPISMVMHVRMRQIQMLALMVFGLFLRLGLVFLASVYAVDMMAEFYAVSGAIFYFVALIVFCSVANQKVEKIS